MAFAHEARRERSRTFLAHIRFATTGARTLANTHPFQQDGRLFAHNGMLGGLTQLDAELGDDFGLVKGQTDSERLFALITRETRRHNGNVQAGIVTAIRWVAAQLPVYSLNLILTTDSDLFALRYPETHTLYVLERGANGRGGLPLHHQSSLLRVDSEEAARRPAVVVASEPMDDDPGWRALSSGELLYVNADLEIRSTIVLLNPPARLLNPSDLSHDQLASQSIGASA
jgi:predicted glutamine amidotransferase